MRAAGLLDPVGGQKQIEFSLQGPDLQQLDRLGQQALARIRTIPGLVDLDSSAKPNKPTISVQLKRDAASDLGIGTAQLAASLRTLVAGQSAGNWRAPDDETYDIQVRLPLAGRSTLEQLRALPLVIGSNADGSARVVRLSQVAEVSESTGASQINRRALTREVTITGNAYARSIGEISADIRRELDALLADDGGGFVPYVQTRADEPVGQFAPLDRNPDWSAYFLWHHGRRVEDHIARCPATMAMLEGVPQVEVAQRAPAAFFSALKPRTRIPPHNGATNCRLTVHLPLVIPPGCGIRVGNHTRGWTPGAIRGTWSSSAAD